MKPNDPSRLSGEDALIFQLAKCLPSPLHTRLALGDDAAAIELPGSDLLLVTTDLLMEGVHFRLSWGDLPALGWKALAQNLSDIAAMGGIPSHAVIALALPASWTSHEATALYQGLSDLATRTKTDIIGGDTIRSAGPLTITITALGRVTPAEMLTRSGAKAGEALFVTGILGRAAAGLLVLDAGRPIPEHLSPAVQAQLRPQPRLEAGRALAGSGRVTAMMDLSDGVATDIHRLCLASGVGVVIEHDRLPIDPVVVDSCAWLAEGGIIRDPVTVALTGGEDFELLFTAPVEAELDLRERLAPLPLTRIGMMTDSLQVELRHDDQTTPLPWGFTHF